MKPESAEELNIDDVDTQPCTKEGTEIERFHGKHQSKTSLGIELENDDITSFKRGLSELKKQRQV